MKLHVNPMRLKHVARAFGKDGRLFVRPDWQDYSMMDWVTRTFRGDGGTYTAFKPLPIREQVIEVIDLNFDTGELRGRWVGGPNRGGLVLTSVNFVWPLTPRGDILVTGESHPYGDRQL